MKLIERYRGAMMSERILELSDALYAFSNRYDCLHQDH